MTIDDLDKRIIQRLSLGISSYEDLARECNVTRNTIYRRMSILEKKGIIKRITRVVPNYDKLGIEAVFVAAEVAEDDQDRALALIKADPEVKFLWRTYGNHNIISIAFCGKGEEGQTIRKLKLILERFKAVKIRASVGYVWEKLDFTPFGEAAGPALKEETLVAPERGRLRVALP